MGRAEAIGATIWESKHRRVMERRWKQDDAMAATIWESKQRRVMERRWKQDDAMAATNRKGKKWRGGGREDGRKMMVCSNHPNWYIFEVYGEKMGRR
jgi:hypothetical protein